jgi:hypothetical protein
MQKTGNKQTVALPHLATPGPDYSPHPTRIMEIIAGRHGKGRDLR